MKTGEYPGVKNGTSPVAKDVDFRLYLITDRNLFTDKKGLISAVESALEGGVRAVQLREKDLCTRELLDMAYLMRKMTRRHHAKLFINDRLDIAMAVDADGVHLGGSSMPVAAARRLVKKTMIIGASAHGVGQAEELEKEGVEFVTIGPVYETPSKMRYGKPLGVDILRKAINKISVPIFAIGGIKLPETEEVVKAGAFGIALISGILVSNDIKSRTEEFMRLLQ